MSSMTTMLLVVFTIQFALITTGLVSFPGSDLLELLQDPSNITGSSFYDLIDDLLITIGAGIVIGSIVMGRELAVFAGISVVFLSFVATLSELWIQIEGQTNPFLATMFVSPIILIYIITIIMFWRGKTTS